MSHHFHEIVTTEEEIRATLGQPLQRALDKVITSLDHHCREFIAASPFLLIGSSDGQGNLDVSPKGDPPGFVHVLDDTTLAIPDRVGNRRADTLINLVKHSNIGLLFLVPGKQETLRVNGTAQIVRDAWLREQLAMKGKVPDLAIVVRAREVYYHCAKCMIRSRLWDQESWPQAEGLASLARVMVDHTRSQDGLERMEAAIAESYRDRLY